MKSEVRELLTEELKDAYSAEKQALRCMQKALRKASAQALREGIQLHIEQTQVQIERVEQAMEKMNVRPGRKVCEAMRGLVDEAQHEIEEDVAALLAETLEEEKQTDLKLTEVTQKAIMPEALAGEEEEDGGERSGGRSGATRKKAA
jgi:ferritin-like metal-binding protein YciE